jgi:hypothetical protein
MHLTIATLGYLTELPALLTTKYHSICAVHGLGGNAIDTWTADNNKMWLRDFLPMSAYFKKSRIMTFGYDGDLTDQRTIMRVEDWAENLLHSVSEARTSEKEGLGKWCLYFYWLTVL